MQLNKTMIKGLISMVGVKNIEPAFHELISKVMEMKKDLALQPGETDVAIMLYTGQDQQAYYTIAFIDKDNKILRFEQTKLITEFVKEMLNTL